MSDQKIGIGIIGLGGFGHFLYREWSKMEEAHVLAVSDQDESRMEGLGGTPTFYEDYRELLNDERVDVVSIAAPPSTHFCMAMEAIKCGKHVLIEKPVALTAEEGRTIEAASKEAGVVATVNFMLRFDPLVEGLRRVIERGVFGKPMRVDLRNYATQETVPPGHWFWDHSVSGGILVEHAVHFFDMTSYMLQTKAVSASGLTMWRNREQEDRVFAAVKFDCDAVGTYWHSFTRPKPIETTTFHISFDLGEIEMNGWVPLSASFWGWTNDEGISALREHLPGVTLTVEKMAPFETHSSDRSYKVTANIKGAAEVEGPKLEVYGRLVRLMMSDVIAAIKDPNHRLRVSMEDAIDAVATAEEAAADANSKER